MPNTKAKTKALDAVREHATKMAVKISCNENYRAERAALRRAIDEARYAGCFEYQIEAAQAALETTEDL